MNLTYASMFKKQMRRWFQEWRRRLRDILVLTLKHAPDALQKHVVQRLLVRRCVLLTGEAPKLAPPVTFNEHILHRIIHDRDPRLKVVNDKVAVRGFIAETVGDEFVVPLLGVWRSASEIDWDCLPASFVLKPSHSSNQLALVKSASDRDLHRLAHLAASWLEQDYFSTSLEWGYLGLPRRILAEPLLTGPTGEPPMELQIQVVRGKTIQIGVITGEKGKPDRYGDWFYANGLRHPGRTREPLRHGPMPAFIHEQVVPIAEKVAAGFEQMRVDFYVTSQGLKIGELTPYHSGGRANFDPPELDLEMGRLWTGALSAN